MKRLLTGLAVAAALLFAGQVSAQESHLNRILSDGKLRVGTTGDFIPMSFKDPGSDEYKGHHIDLARKLAADMGVDVVFVPTDWKTLINGLVADKYDIVMTGTSMSVGRAKSAAFTNPIGVTGFLPLVQKKDAGRFSDWESFNKPEVKIAVNLGTTMVPFIQSQLPNATLVQVESPARDWQELLAGRVDATITSIVEGSGLADRYSNLQLMLQDQIRNSIPLALLVQQGDPTWLTFMNNWIDIQKSTGFLAANNKKWNLQGQPY